MKHERRRLVALLVPGLLWSGVAWCGYGGYVPFQTVPGRAGSGPTAPYSLLISGTFPAFATVANGGKVVNTAVCGVNAIVCPLDLIFAQDAACNQPYAGWEVLGYAPASGQLSVAVEIPLLSSSTPVRVFGCVGNAAVTTFQGGGRGAGYDSHYLLALHMDEVSGTTLHDSTANGNDATKKAASSPAGGATGVVGGAQTFVGTANSTNNDYARFGAPTAATSTWTIEYWTKAISYINGDAVFLGSSSGAPTVFAGFYWYPSGTVQFRNSYTALSPTAAAAAAGAFHYVVFARNGDSMNVYLDGVAGTPASGWGTGAEQWRGLGWDNGASVAFNSFNGAVDEVFYSDIARNADYVTARFHNVSDPSSFYTSGPYVAISNAPPPAVTGKSQVHIFF